MMKQISNFVMGLALCALCSCSSDSNENTMTVIPNEIPLPLIEIDSIAPPSQEFQGVDDSEIESKIIQEPAIGLKGDPDTIISSDKLFHKVSGDESFEDIAKRYNCEVSALKNLNGTAKPKNGYSILLPRNLNNIETSPDVKIYTIEAGENLGKISQKFKLSVDAIKKLNNKPDDKIKVKEQIYVPKN